MVSTAEKLKLIVAETARLTEYLRGTGQEEWALDSPCEGWTVGDVIGHLGWAAEFFADSISRGRADITTAPDGLPEVGSIPGSEIPDFIASAAKEYNLAAGADLADAFSSSVDRLNGIFSIVEEDGDWSTQCWSWRGLRTAEAYVSSRLSELVIHSWDIRYPSNNRAGLSPDCVAPVLERLPVWLNELGLAEFKPAKTPARYRIQTTGPADFMRDVVAGDQENRVEEAQGEPTATFTCHADYLALLVWGRLKPGPLLDEGKLTVTPGTGTGQEFASWLAS
ncbi:MAG: maleylpyruvate isomerase family mycothiol-dependent enzyme [Chloroflexi bacterium]|nr:maleylpyruvate isomerase family mycothiol-dependent enzyme [Chloroflexota bacterium]